MRNLNLVLLGLPSSGKSALLGALQEAAEIKGTELEGTLVDLTGGELAKLRKASLDEKYRPTSDPVAAYPIKRRAAEDDTYVVHDTSGKDAQLVLAGNASAKDPLGRTLAEADGVLVVIDASMSREERGKQFGQVSEFLKGWQTRRGKSAEVGGLPVHVVLTKCDKLATKEVSKDEWKAAVQKICREAKDQLEAELADSRGQSFGRIDIEVIPAAAKWPFGEKGNRPFHVDKVFQHIFDAARAHRERGERAAQTLHGSLVGLLSAAMLFLLVIGWYALTRPTADEATFESHVESLLAGTEGNVSETVREPIQDRLKELKNIQTNPLFSTLPASVRTQVETAEKTILAYDQVNKDFFKDVQNPRLTQSTAKLEQIEKALTSFDAAVAQWPETRLAKRHAEWLKDTRALQSAVKEEEAWNRQQIEEGEKLRAEAGLVIAKQVDKKERDAWFKAVHEYDVRGPRHKGVDRLPDTTIPYRIVYQFDTVVAADRDWRQFKKRLSALREEARIADK